MTFKQDSLIKCFLLVYLDLALFFFLFQMPELDILAAKMNAEFEEAESFELVVE